MSLTDQFSGHSTSLPSPKTRPAPFSLRLTTAERAQLIADARGAPLGAYIKAKALGTPTRSRRSGLPVHDAPALAQVLALLGQSHIAGNLNQIAHGVNIGTMPVTPETEAELSAALMAVREMRSLLLIALGHKSGDAP